jgi:hypothetical protein
MWRHSLSNLRLLAWSVLLFSYPTAARCDEDLVQKSFDDMYNLSFAQAHQVLKQWQTAHPQDPLGPAADGAAYLYAEFDRLEILQSEFFVDDRTFSERKRVRADPQVKQSFDQALARSEQLATAKLRQSPNDESALFANVLRLGLQADYDALIEKQNIQALRTTKEGRRLAEGLLTQYPDCYDAYVAIGVENYLLSLKAAPIRWILRATGAQTDKDIGIAKLKLTAAKGKYLQPYAQLLLAVAALRDKDNAEARRLLSGLANRFPQNRLYREELSKIH